MCSTLSPKVKEVILSKLLNIPQEKSAQFLAFQTTDVSEEHSSKAYLPMLFTLLPIDTVLKLEQPENADSPTLVTLLGIVTEVREEQS